MESGLPAKNEFLNTRPLVSQPHRELMLPGVARTDGRFSFALRAELATRPTSHRLGYFFTGFAGGSSLMIDIV
jgi:hypothetical protein